MASFRRIRLDADRAAFASLQERKNRSETVNALKRRVLEAIMAPGVTNMVIEAAIAKWIEISSEHTLKLLPPRKVRSAKSVPSLNSSERSSQK